MVRQSYFLASKGSYGIILLIIICSSCSSTRKNNYNSRYFYKQDYSFDNIVTFKACHTSDSTLDIYFHLNLKKLPENSTIKNTSHALPRFHYVLWADSKNANVIDSHSIFINIEPGQRHDLQYRFNNIRCRDNKLRLRTELYVPEAGKHFNNSSWLDFSSPFGSSYFRATHLPDSVFETETYFTNRDSIFIDHYKPGVQRLYIRYSPLIGRPAPPPFYHGNEKIPVADFKFKSSIPNHSGFGFQKEGNYLIQGDTMHKEGLWLNCFSAGFPFTEQINEYLYPLLYLTSEDEFKQLQDNKDIKGAVNEFWARSAGSEKRGSVIADKFYHRVETSNEDFSTSKEGWKTDRGMIYIIFGKPDIIYKESWGENWTYYEHFPYPGAEFHFNRALMPWGEDFTLVRGEQFRRLWYLAVDAWRNGRVNE
jgi:GWxTD domain-containing protein